MPMGRLQCHTRILNQIPIPILTLDALTPLTALPRMGCLAPLVM